jgi:anaerobic ribonucleoside-triphosphate reductase activating protein
MGDTMRYSGIIRNDLAAAPGVSVTFCTQGCTHRCKGCHNPETWDFNGGKEFTHKSLDEIYEALSANGIARSFCVMGGEPLCNENLFLTLLVLKGVKQHFPQIKIYLWTGYYYEDLIRNASSHMEQVLDLIDVLIDGPYIESKRDVTLPLRGSSNQSIIDLKEKRNEGKGK